MKKYIKYGYLFFCFVLLFLIGFSFGYEQKGFSQYQESLDGISFICENQCIISLGQDDEIDYLYLTGTLNGSGIIGYGFYVGNEFSFLSQYEFTKYSNINKFTDFMAYFRQLRGKLRDLNLLISGNVQGNLYLQTGNLSLLQKIDLVWRNFWKIEVFGQYSSNQRYGVLIRGISIVTYGYIIFVLIFLGVLLFKRGKQKNKLMFYVGLGLFLLIGFRNTLTYTLDLKEGLSGFKSDKTYFEFGDYFSFVDKIRDKLELDSGEYKKNDCKILLEYDTGFNYGPLDIYFKPCELALTGESANYKIYYKREIPVEDLDKTVLLEFNGSYLLENKSK